MATKIKIKVSKSQILLETKNVIFVLIGSLILAFADAAFLTPGNIISGGVVSIGIISQYYYAKGPTWLFGLEDINDIVVIAVQVILWFVGLFTLGKKFSINTLVASVAYPLFYTLLFRFNVSGSLGIEAMMAPMEDGAINTAGLMLAGIFGGALAGAGVAVSYLGNGSTGGFDIVSFIIAKYSEMKEDVSGFIIDGSLILIGMICMWSEPNEIIRGLVGVMAALSCAVAVQYIYVNSDTFVIVDIISDRYEEIQEYIHKEMNHGTTVINTVGGFSGEERKMIRVIIYQIETTELRNKIAEIDPKAFVSFTQAKTINGEGFEPFVIPRHKLRPRSSLKREVMAEQYAELDAKKAAEEEAKKGGAATAADETKPTISTDTKSDEKDSAKSK
jgi:uncharacterized membrane-anchored protein YitT (DUF2179 family)